MKRICGWCHKSMESQEPTNGPATHGICSSCSEFFHSNRPGRTMQEFLDGLGAPVLVVDAEANVRGANQAACARLGCDLRRVNRVSTGEALECAHARLPQGCGNQTCCKACTIRRSVMETFATRRSSERVPAFQDIETVNGRKRMRLSISTKMVGEVVLLRIDEMEDERNFGADSAESMAHG